MAIFREVPESVPQSSSESDKGTACSSDCGGLTIKEAQWSKLLCESSSSEVLCMCRVPMLSLVLNFKTSKFPFNVSIL